MSSLEPTGRELRQMQRQMREDFYHRQGEEPPTFEAPVVVMVDTSEKAPVEPPVRKAA